MAQGHTAWILGLAVVSWAISRGSALAYDEPVLVRPPDQSAARSLDRLEGRSLSPIRARWNPSSGRLLSFEGRFPFPDASLPEASLRFLAGAPDLFGIDPLIDLVLAHRKVGLGTEHLRFRAYLGGVPLAGVEVTFHFDSSSPGTPHLIYLESRLPPPGPGRDASAVRDFLTPRLSAAEAMGIAGAAVSPRGLLRSEASAGLEVLPFPLPGKLTYAVWVDSLEPRGLFLVRVDATEGRVVSEANLLRYGPPGKRDGKGKVFLVNPVVAMKDTTLSDADDAAEAVPPQAYAEVVLPDLDGEGGLTGPYITTEPTPHAVRRTQFEFSFLRDHDGFEEVMAYYHIDLLQRAIQSLRFNDVYNARIPVYVNSEPPGIPYLDQQAYFMPDIDESGTGIIAFGSGGADSAEDAEVIVHEYGHAIQNNQVPGFGGGFESMDASAIGEGFSDWLAGAHLSALSGGFGDACVGDWMGVTSPFPWEEPTGCVRRLDSDKKYPDSMEGEPHADGEMWSSSLWEVFQVLGREDSLRLVIQSNFFLGQAPTFLDAALAVLRSDQLLFQGQHQELLRKVFTDRGFLAEPLNLSWFYLRKHPSPLQVLGGREGLSKLKIVRGGRISPDPRRPLLVYLNFTHPFIPYLEVSLRSPSGSSLRLLNPADGRFLPTRPMVFGATVEPSDSLQAFAGEPISGTWTLHIVNDSPMDGALSEWGLAFDGFLRGDASGDRVLDLSDAIALLQYLFLGGSLSCPKAGDFNDDGSLTVTDAVASIRHLVGGGPPPPEPFPQAGEDLTPDDLACGE